MKPIRYEMKTASCNRRNFHIGLPYPIRYEMKTVSCKRGLIEGVFCESCETRFTKSLVKAELKKDLEKTDFHI